MKTKWFASLLGLATLTAAQAQGVFSIGFTFGSRPAPPPPVYIAPPVCPAPVVVAAPFYAPPPVVYYAPPVVATPAPVVVTRPPAVVTLAPPPVVVVRPVPPPPRFVHRGFVPGPYRGWRGAVHVGYHWR